MKTFLFPALLALFTATAAHAESLLIPRLAGGWNELSTNPAVAQSAATAPIPEGSGEGARDPFFIQIAGTWHCYYAATEKDKGAIFLRTSPDRTTWSERKMVATGGKAGTGPASAENPCVVEAEPGHFYLFRTQREEGKVATSVYHSTDPADFGLEGKYGDALHFVTTLPVAATQVVKKDGTWFAVGAEQKVARLEWQPIATPARPTVRKPGIKIRVALYDDSGSTGKGIPAVSEQLGRVPDIEVTKLDADGIRAGLSGYDVVIFTGGSGGKQANTIGLLGREQTRRFVEAGGGYVGICAGAYLACEGFSWGLKVLDARTPSPKWERGRAELKIETTAAGQKLLGLPKECVVTYHNGPVLVPANNPSIPDFEPLVYFRSETAKVPEQAGLQINTPALARSTFGAGRVLVSSPHPEQTAGMEEWIVRAVRAVAGS
jgi:glutamine amidotransferase-like uncharacterized protein